MVVPTLANVRAIPLTNKVERAYGGSRGRVAARNAVLVRVETSDGTVGWGECFGAPAVVLPLIEELAT